MTDHITAQQFEEAGGTNDWSVVGEGACTFFATGSFAAGTRFVEAIGKLPGVDDHPPAVDLRADGVTVRLITQEPQYRGMTERDVQVARQISTTARDLGLTADPSAAQTTLLIPGAPDPAVVMPFWRAVLGYDPRPDSPDEDLVDPRDRNPSFWFEQMDKPRADWRWRDPRGDLGAAPTGRGPGGSGARSRWSTRPRRLCADVVDAGRRGRQRGRRGHHARSMTAQVRG